MLIEQYFNQQRFKIVKNIHYFLCGFMSKLLVAGGFNKVVLFYILLLLGKKLSVTLDKTELYSQFFYLYVNLDSYRAVSLCFSEQERYFYCLSFCVGRFIRSHQT